VVREGDAVSFGRERQSGEAKTLPFTRALKKAGAVDSVLRAHRHAWRGIPAR